MEDMVKQLLEAAAKIPYVQKPEVRKGEVLVCLWTAEETAGLVSFLSKNEVAAKGFTTPQEMLAQAVVGVPDILIVAEDTSPNEVSDVVTKVRNYSAWPDDYLGGPVIILILRTPPPPSPFICSFNHVADMSLVHPVSNQELLMFVRRLQNVSNNVSDEGRYQI